MLQTIKDNIIVLCVMLTLILVATVAVYLPQGRKLASLKTERVTQKQSLQCDAQKASGVSEMQRDVQEMKNRYKNFDRRLPKQKELGGFLREISANLSHEKLANQSIEPGVPSKEDLFHTLPISMKFQGSYASLVNFLKRIDNMERLTRVYKMTVMTNDKTSAVNIELLMNIYFSES
jgi:Tfp pilus assembly protein PilO